MGNGSVGGATSASRVGNSNSGVQAEVATVQKDETTLAQVADRIGYSEAELRQANPQIKNPNQLKAGQDIHLPEKTTSPRPGEKTLADVAKRLGVTEHALKSANPHIKDPNDLKSTDKINNPEYYENKDASQKSKPEPKTASKKNDEKAKVGASKDGISASHPKIGKVNVSPGGDAEYTSPKIGPVEVKITGEGVGPKLPQSKGDRIQNPKQAEHKPNDYKHMDGKEKLDKEQKAPGEKITDREIRKGVHEENIKDIKKEFDARQALERLKNPIPKKGTLRMSD